MINNLIIFLFLAATTVGTTQSVRFMETDLETAISMAERQKKNLFIDTYTEYCKPCKKMEIEFRDPELANYFNNNFINVRVNMEGDRSEAYQNAYQVVFLPTMIFATAQGGQRMKIDHLVTSEDLLKFAKHINGEVEKAVVANSTIAPPPPAPKVVEAPKVSHPVTRPITKPTAPKAEATKPIVTPKIEDISVAPSEGKILYVMGQDADNLPPEILKEEAYFRMQLMDGSHHDAAKKYLATQEDWSTEENIRFISDFINDSRSEKFLYLIENRAAFDKVLGQEEITRTISILVQKELERGYPRPDYKRAKTLYAYTAALNADFQAACYHMNTLYETDKHEEFISYGKDHIKNEAVPAELLYRYASTLAQKAEAKKALKSCLSIAARAEELEKNEITYPVLCAQLCCKLKDKKRASLYLVLAQALSKGDTSKDAELAKLSAAIKNL